MRYLSANIIFPISSAPIKNGVVIIDENGEIKAISRAENNIDPNLIEFFEGILCPGFVNTHCHLELSHLKGKIQEHTHIDGFVKELQSKRNTNDLEIQEAIKMADAEMWKNGIIAVGDISNGNSSFTTKANSNIYYHTFLECFGFNPSQAKEVYSRAKGLEVGLTNLNLPKSIVAHSPYSVSNELFDLILVNHQSDQPICIHNQENKDENTFYQSGKGRLAEMLQSFGISMDHWEANLESSLKGYLKKLPQKAKTLLVHNTFTSENDIDFAEKSNQNIFWCFCPNANQYIENTLPNIPLFVKKKVKCTIGTDSLASNYGLSVLGELKVISKTFPDISTATLLEWATINGAQFLGIDDQFGSFEVGKKPGINWIKHSENGVISEKSDVEKLK